MKLPSLPTIRQIRCYGKVRLARAGNLLYNVASAAQREYLRGLLQNRPESDFLVMSPEQIKTLAAGKVTPTLQHIVKKVSGQKIDETRVLETVLSGMRSGLFENFGNTIKISEYFIDALLQLLGLPADPATRAAFVKAAKEYDLLKSSYYTAAAKVEDAPRHARGKTYHDGVYEIKTRDGITLKLSRVISQGGEVETNDSNPSVLLLPGIACRINYFDRDSRSFLLDLADAGLWTYGYEPRGMGRNKGLPNPNIFLDNYVSDDLPAVVEFVSRRPSPNKPVVLVGHSMGGIIALFMVVRQAYKLDEVMSELTRRTGGSRTYSIRGMSRAEIAADLGKLEGRKWHRETDKEIAALIARARNHLEILSAVKGIISVCSPMIFDKDSSLLFPLLLSLGIVLPALRAEEVPVGLGKSIIKRLPRLSAPLRTLINSRSFDNPRAFLASLVVGGTDSFPLGVGLQFEKAIYGGKGIKRMDGFNYSANLDLIPVDLPIFPIMGADDPLAPPFSSFGFIDPSTYDGRRLDFSIFPRYRHRLQTITRLRRGDNSDRIAIAREKSQVRGFEIEGLSHLDIVDGAVGETLVRPLIKLLIWAAWEAE